MFLWDLHEKFILDIDNSFNELTESIIFEDIAKGRKGAILVNNKNNLIPIVRTTTNYNNPVQKFLPIHYKLMDNIRKKFKNNIIFNNAMFEIYDSQYRTMKFYSDQSLDLEAESYICLFSCYENESNNPNDIRKLQVQNKISKDEFEVTLNHNSIIIFSTKNNLKYLHKIILDSKQVSKNKWLGITFRLSKTFVSFINDTPYINTTNIILTIANNDERKEFYKHKGDENNQIDYRYESINYTISKSDLLPIYN